MEINFECAGVRYCLPPPQATVLAENLRLFAAGKFQGDVKLVMSLGGGSDWRSGALAAADFIEEALVGNSIQPIPLEGMAAEPTYWVLRLMMDIEPDPKGAAGLRSALEPLVPLSSAARA